MIRFIEGVVTADMARKFLDKNIIINRKLRPSVVRDYTQLILRREWGMSHQAMAFDTDGRLSDGQHRCHAIIAAADIDPTFEGLRMVVAYGVPAESFAFIDSGTARTLADRTEHSIPVIAIVNTLTKMLVTNFRSHKVTPLQVDVALEHFGSQISLLLGDATKKPKIVKIFSSSHVRVGVVCQMYLNPGRETEINDVYQNLCLLDYMKMAPPAMSLLRQATCPGIPSKLHLFLRSLYAFDPKNIKKTKIYLKDTSGEVARLRERLKIPLDAIRDATNR